MFPYVCLATMPLFCEVNWPRKCIQFVLRRKIKESGMSEVCIYNKIPEEKSSESKKQEKDNVNFPTEPNWKHKLIVCLLLTHCGLQIFMPYSHFITKVR